ncbi:MAG: peptide chain release factor N(5)-glutamine methyltransferase, partial [Actinobacteria bacterium]|nr:peptide chain release factor N(5)-glutamine methyltransferase [Actinomycetota bacterium]
MSSTRSAIVDATHRLTRAGVSSPGVDAELLLAHVLGVSRGNLILSRDLSEEQQRAYNDL